jgi:hypothetical protein
MKKMLTSFTKFTTGEGERVSFTFSEVSEKGELVNPNIKGNFIVMSDEILSHLKAVDDYIKENYLKEE